MGCADSGPRCAHSGTGGSTQPSFLAGVQNSSGEPGGGSIPETADGRAQASNRSLGR
jgi:hypothetical protein